MIIDEIKRDLELVEELDTKIFAISRTIDKIYKDLRKYDGEVDKFYRAFRSKHYHKLNYGTEEEKKELSKIRWYEVNKIDNRYYGHIRSTQKVLEEKRTSIVEKYNKYFIDINYDMPFNGGSPFNDFLTVAVNIIEDM